MNLHIRQATSQDIDAVLNITKACARAMIGKGIFQWNENYPNREAFEQDVVREELYVLLDAEAIIGCMVISSHMDEEYKSLTWLTPNTQNLYIHRFAIHPTQQGTGKARFFMEFAEQFAIENAYCSIRLDTFSKNHRNQKFYELRGYKKLDDVYFPNQSVYPFHCYERIL
jgi:ribosomal protein S18 acetylase RimI-like enzyme